MTKDMIGTVRMRFPNKTVERLEHFLNGMATWSVSVLKSKYVDNVAIVKQNGCSYVFACTDEKDDGWHIRINESGVVEYQTVSLMPNDIARIIEEALDNAG